MCLCDLCSHVVVFCRVCEVVLVPYVVAVVAMTVVRVLFALHVCILRECDDNDNAGVGGVVAVSRGREFMGGARG